MSIGEDAPLVFRGAPRKTQDTLRLRKIQTALLGSFAPASTIGLARARVKIGLANLVYNMRRALWLTERRAMA